MNDMSAKENVFFDLSSPGFGKGSGPCSLVTRQYEREIAARNGGLDLEKGFVLKQLSENDREHYARMIPFFKTNSSDADKGAASVVNLHESIQAPCSLLVSDGSELEEHVLRFYQTSYAHYVFGERLSIKFPYNCCGLSARNVMFSLIAHGYPMASYGYSTYDHGMAFIPFVQRDESIQGAVVIDPTSDQLWRSLNYKPRNSVFITYGIDWEYRTNWYEGGNLIPSKVLHLSLARNMLEDSMSLMDSECYTSFKHYMARAWNNPLNVPL